MIQGQCKKGWQSLNLTTCSKIECPRSLIQWERLAGPVKVDEAY